MILRIGGERGMSIHVVKYGDYLWGIASQYRTTVAEILRVNGLPSSLKLVPGQAIYIPDETTVLRYYVIKPGDNLWKLSQTFRTDIQLILNANPSMDPNHLFVGQKIAIPSPEKLPLATLGFIIPYSQETFLTDFEQISNQLTYLAITAYSLTDQGFAYNVLEDRKIVTKSREVHVIPLLMIRNLKGDQFSPELIGAVLENEIYRRNLVLSITNLAKQRNYGGVSIDFEFIPPPRRKDFNRFLTELKKSLENLILHVNVHAKTQDLPQNRIVGAYDYHAIGKAADIVAVMTVDYGYPTGPPDPISPLWWLAQVIRYSLSQISHPKLQIALSLYGYDKEVKTNATSAFSVLAAQNQAITLGAPIQYDLNARSPWYRYWKDKIEHIVWFEDIRSYQEKYNLIDQYELLGATYWQLSLPAPQNWNYLKKNIRVLKS